MSGVDEARQELENQSIIVSSSEVTSSMLIAGTKDLFSKGYGDVELIAKIGDAQIAYIELMDAGEAKDYQELAEEIRLNLLNDSYIIENGIVGDSLTIQALTQHAQEELSQLDQWKNDESNYFSLNNEEGLSPTQQIEALINVTKSIANSTNELNKLQFLLRPTVLHENLLKALMDLRGIKFDRIELDSGNNGEG